MASPDPEHINWFLEHIGKILTALTVAILALVKYIAKDRNAELARNVLIEKPVSHADLLQCRLEVTQIISANMKDLRDEVIEEIRRIHDRINDHHG